MRMGKCYLILGCITLNCETGVGSTLTLILLAVLLVILRCVQLKLNSHKNRLTRTWRESTVSVERTQTGIHKVCFKSLSWFLTKKP